MGEPGVFLATDRKTGAQTVLYRPTTKQLAFHRHPAPNRLYGGARGGGKSTALRWDAHLAGFARPGVKMLLLRRSFPELLDTHIQRLEAEATALNAIWLKSEYKLTYPTGSVLQCGHCQDDQAVTRYLSTEYDRIYFDELVTFTLNQFLLIGASNRSTLPGVVPQILAATNPGGAGAQWVKRYFIDRDLTPDEDPHYRAEEYAYIPATLDDNPYLDATYEKRLLALPPDLRRAYRYGDWDIFPGQYFPEWRRTSHVHDQTYPTWMPRIRGLDWGYNQPGVCTWYVCCPDGHLYAEDEYVFRETLARTVATEIYRRTRDRQVTVRYTAADPSMWIRDGQSGESLAETFARAGVPLVRARHDRVNGWQRLRAWLAVAPDGRPWLELAPRCVYGIRTIPSQLLDPHQPEDLNTDGEDHWVDQARYVVMSRPWPGGAAPAIPYPRDAVGHLFQEAQAEARSV